MDSILVRGGNELDGVIPIAGAKNACLMAARIAATSDAALTQKMEAWMKKEAEKVAASRAKLENLPAAPEEAYR